MPGMPYTEEVNAWNALPGGEMAEADVIVALKRLFERHKNMQGMEGYRSRSGRRDQFNLASCLTDIMG